MYKMLFITDYFESFVSSWGVIAIPKEHESGFVMPLGWEEELTERGIDFEVIEIEYIED